MTLAERRQREKEQRRESIINAASRLFFKKGYDKVTMDDIASEAELSKATIYTYFKDKDSIFFAVVNQGIKILDSIMKKEEERLQIAGVKFGSVKNAFKQFVIEYPDYARAYFLFRSGKFDLSNDKDMSVDAKEILEFNKYCSKRGIIELNNCIENGVNQSGLNPVVTVALYFLINDSISNINPDIKKMLEDSGITVEQFFREVMEFLDRTFMNSNS